MSRYKFNARAAELEVNDILYTGDYLPVDWSTVTHAPYSDLASYPYWNGTGYYPPVIIETNHGPVLIWQNYPVVRHTRKGEI